MSQAEDIAAIKNYFNTVGSNTPAAFSKQIEAQNYLKNLSWYETTADSKALAKATAYRNEFNKLNTVKAKPKSVGTAAAVAIADAPSTRLTIKQGSTGSNVKEWQKVIGVDQDGRFGPDTRAKTITWQRNNGLPADGVVGPKSWQKAIELHLLNYASTAVSDAVAKGTPVSTAPAKSLGTPARPIGGNVAPANPAVGTLIKQGSTGNAVKAWQKIVGTKESGVFDATLVQLTKAWQTQHGLKADGIVGPMTWAASAVVLNTPGAVSSAPVFSKANAAKVADAVIQNVKAAPAAIATKGVAAAKAAPAAALAHAQAMPLWAKVTFGTLAAGFAVLGLSGPKKR